jgi:hypothetical protein
MPKPEDFGITKEDWGHGDVANASAYKEALKVWERVCKDLTVGAS